MKVRCHRFENIFIYNIYHAFPLFTEMDTLVKINIKYLISYSINKVNHIIKTKCQVSSWVDQIKSEWVSVQPSALGMLVI